MDKLTWASSVFPENILYEKFVTDMPTGAAFNKFFRMWGHCMYV